MIKSEGIVALPQNITVERNISDVVPLKFSADHTFAVLITLRRTSLRSYKIKNSKATEIEDKNLNQIKTF